MAVAPVSDLVVDVYLPGQLGISPSPVTTHNGASQTNYLSMAGNHVGDRPSRQLDLGEASVVAAVARRVQDPWSGDQVLLRAVVSHEEHGHPADAFLEPPMEISGPIAADRV